MKKQSKGRDLNHWNSNLPASKQGRLRIIGGRLGGRQIAFSGDLVTRPMKHNIREAVFNLVGGWVPGKVAIDLFAGSGAIGLEAISRGASAAIMIERHFPTAKIIEQNVAMLEVNDLVTIDKSDTLFWARSFLKNADARPTEPWIVFCSPPYAMFLDQADDLIWLIESLLAVAPEQSIFVVESDNRFDPGLLPHAVRWKSRIYSPAVVHILRDLTIEALD